MTHPHTVDDATLKPSPLTPTPLLPGSSNFRSVDGSALDLDGMDAQRKKNSQITSHNLRSPQFTQWMSKVELHVTSIHNSVGGFTTKLAELEQNSVTLATRMLALEGGN